MLRRSVMAVLIFGFLAACAHVGTGEEDPERTFSPLSSLVRFYQGPLNHLAAVRRGECPMYPSCSEYSAQSLQKHGPAIGWMMTCDRLMRCGRDEMKLSPRIFVDGKWKYHDPVENNDVWWNQEMRSLQNRAAAEALPVAPRSTDIP